MLNHFRRLLSRRGATPLERRDHQAQLNVELLDERQMLATFTVTNLDDSGAGSLRDAILQANATTGADEIDFSVTGDIDLDSGQLTITDALTITGPGSANLSVNQTASNSRVFYINTDSGDVLISGLTISGGDLEGEGGGIFATGSGTLTVSNSLITGNAAYIGGGIASQANLIVTNSQFTNNYGFRLGGGIAFYASVETGSTSLTITSSTFEGNSTIGGGGGVSVYAINANANVVIQGDTSFTGNTASNGGGLSLYLGGTDATVTVQQTTISGNSATGSGGGLYFYVAHSAENATILLDTVELNNNEADRGGGANGYSEANGLSLTVRDSNVSGNTADGYGGGMALWLGSNGGSNNTVLFENTTISNNDAENDGGGLYVDFDAVDSSFTIVGGAISGNTANNDGSSGRGGGGVFLSLYYSGGTQSFTVSGVTFDNNQAIQGGGLALYAPGVGGTATISGSTFTNNRATGSSFYGYEDGDGGGLFANLALGSSTLTITGSTFSNNTAEDSGGGVWIDGGASITLVDTNITENTATEDDGGGLRLDSDLRTTTFSMTGGSVSDNTAGDRGGGIWSDNMASMTLLNVDVIGNTADSNGGGIYLETFLNGASFSMTGGSVSENEAGGRGGGLSLSSTPDGSVLIDGVTISHNSAENDGGGLQFFIDARGSVLITGGTQFIGNEASNGGGIHASLDGSSARLTVEDTVFSQNIASAKGGGLNIVFESVFGEVILRDLQVLGNEARAGGGMSITDEFGPSDNSVTIEDTLIQGNTTDLYGGGLEISLDGVRSSVEITDSEINENTSLFSYGGGGQFDFRGRDSTFAVSNTSVTGNTASSGGGGLYTGLGAAGATLLFTGLTVTDNQADYGGGLQFNLFGEGASATISGSTISGNTATGGADVSGGGIGLYLNGPDVTFLVEDTTVSGNDSAGNGGGLDVASPGADRATLIIRRSTFSENTAAGTGGGLRVDQNAADQTLILENVTLSGNMATGDGGGAFLYLDYEGSVATIRNTTITGNSSGGEGGGLFVYDHRGSTPALITNTIIALNTDGSGANDLAGNDPDDLSVTYSLFSTNPSALISGTNTGNLFDTDPLLGELADNGGPTFTHALLDNSPAINTGDPNFVEPPNTDQRGSGFQRIFAGRVDIGAFESQAGIEFLVVAPGLGSDTIRVLDAVDQSEQFTLTPFPGFLGGIRVATGDVNGDGVDDIITAAGPGGGPHVIVYDGRTQAVIHSFFAYDSGFTGGVFVAAGDVNGDGKADIITGAGAGGGPHVQAFSGEDLSILASFFAYDPGFAGGVQVAVGDVNGDTVGDIITGAGAGGGPHVRAFDVATGAELASFFAYDSGFTGGVFVASGDTDGDGTDEIITGAGAGGGPNVKVFQASGVALQSFFAYDPAFAGGVFVAGGDVDGNGKVDIITGAGPGGGPHVQAFDGETLEVYLSFFAFDASFTGGVFVAGGEFAEEAEGSLSALRVAGGALDVQAEWLTPAQLDAVFLQAIVAWDEPSLASVPVVIRDLPGDLLGLGGASGVIIDADAAGHGWALSEEDLAEGRRVDLLTVLAHELGHVLGLPDLDAAADDLMAAKLEPGVRKLPRQE